MSIFRIKWIAVPDNNDNNDNLSSEFTMSLCTSEFSDDVVNILESDSEPEAQKKQILIDKIQEVLRCNLWWDNYKVEFNFKMENLIEIKLFSLTELNWKPIDEGFILLPFSYNNQNLNINFEDQVLDHVYSIELELLEEDFDKKVFIQRFKKNTKIIFSENSSLINECHFIENNDTEH